MAGDSHYVELLKVSALDNLSNKVKSKTHFRWLCSLFPQTNVRKSQGDLSALANIPGDLIVLPSHPRSTFPRRRIGGLLSPNFLIYHHTYYSAICGLFLQFNHYKMQQLHKGRVIH